MSVLPNLAYCNPYQNTRIFFVAIDKLVWGLYGDQKQCKIIYTVFKKIKVGIDAIHLEVFFFIKATVMEIKTSEWLLNIHRGSIHQM